MTAICAVKVPQRSYILVQVVHLTALGVAVPTVGRITMPPRVARFTTSTTTNNKPVNILMLVYKSKCMPTKSTKFTSEVTSFINQFT